VPEILLLKPDSDTEAEHTCDHEFMQVRVRARVRVRLTLGLTTCDHECMQVVSYT